MRFNPILSALLPVIALTGCATSSDVLMPKVQSRAAAEVVRISAEPVTAPPLTITEHEGEYLALKAVPTGTRGDVTVKAAAAPFGPMVAGLAKQHNYSIVFADNVNVSRKVTADFNKQSLDSVIRGMSRMVGYAVALDKARRVYTIAEQATYTFKLPPSLFQKVSAAYSAGNGAGGSGGGESGGSSASGQAAGGGSTQSSNFTVSGTSSPNSAQIQRMITDQAGAGATVSVTDIGLVTVKAGALGLERATKFIEQLSRDALTQVEVEAAVVEVSLQDDFDLGIDWAKVLPSGNASVGLGGGSSLANLNGINSPAGLLSASSALMQGSSFTGAFTSASIAAVVTNLNKFTNVKIVSRPHVVSMNNVPSTFFAGNNIPYLGSTSISSSTTATTSSGEVSFAANGVTFSVVPSVMSDKLVHLTLLPSLSKVNGFSSFDVQGTKLTAPDQSSRNAYMQIMSESGRTLIIGGMKSSLDTASTSSVLGLVPTSKSDSGGGTELVILIRTHIIPAPAINPLIAESI